MRLPTGMQTPNWFMPTPKTPDDIERKRRLAEKYLDFGTPRNVGEGISALGKGIGAALLNKRANLGQEQGEADFEENHGDIFDIITGNYSKPPPSGYTGVFTSAPPEGQAELTPEAERTADAHGVPVESHSPTSFESLEPEIIRTESGGDVDALYGHRQRSGKFPKVSEMTVGEAMAFSQPGGEYAESVKRELGYTATPMGLYQIVGKTLRDTVDRHGIDPNLPFNEDTQRQIAKLIFQDQGPGAWEGLKNSGGGGGYSGGAGYGGGGGNVPIKRLYEALNHPFAPPAVKQMAVAEIQRQMAAQNAAPAAMWNDLSPQEVEALGLDKGLYQRNSGTGQVKKVGGSLVQVNTGDQGLQLTPGQKKVDEKFADDYVDWFTKGPDQAAQLASIASAISTLESGSNVSGGVVGRMPDWINALLNPKAVQTREVVEKVVQRNLRETLGAQFTEREGERLIKRAYNPTLDEAYNLPRLKLLYKTMEQAFSDNAEAFKYFQENGTLKGYTGARPWTPDDFHDVFDNYEAQNVNPSGDGSDMDFENMPLEELTGYLLRGEIDGWTDEARAAAAARIRREHGL